MRLDLLSISQSGGKLSKRLGGIIDRLQRPPNNLNVLTDYKV